MGKKVKFWPVGIVTVVITGALTLTQLACPGPERQLFSFVARKLDREPQVTVYIKETKKKKTMAIEEYLAGVVAGEMMKGWPIEAYAAQAIVARTFTMDFLARGGTQKLHGTDVSTDENEAQAYNKAAITPQIRRAVAMTKGKVLTYKGRFVRGWFSASCGGRTALAKEGLAFKETEPAYMVSVSCPETQVIPKDELFWEAGFSPTELAAALKQLGKDVGPVQRLEVAHKSRNGRAVSLRAVGAKGRTTVHGADLRTALDPAKMRSIVLLSVESGAQGIKIKGRGFGHGVGLCQWGAHSLAKKGYSPERIVKHYYPKARVMDVW